MPNNRIFYACQAVAIAKSGHSSGATDDSTAGPKFQVMKGVQSVGITTNFTLEQIFELGQVEIYQNVEDVAEVEVTIEKVIDGERLLYLQAVGEIGKTNVVAASNSICDIYLAIYADSTISVSGGTPTNVVMCSGMTPSSISYNWGVSDNAKESITLVGNNKFWNASTYGVLGATPATLFGTGGGSANAINNSDVPVSGVVRRGKFDLYRSVLPAEVLLQNNNVPGSSGIQSVSVKADFGRENQLELGRFGPYNKYATYPFEVTSDFEVTATNGDLVSVSGNNANLLNRSIVIRDTAGTVVDLGSNNKLKSISQSGGDTGGGVATITYSYSTFNSLKVDGGGSYWS